MLTSPPGGIVILAHPQLGDFVRTHSLVQLVRERNPDTPIDIVARTPSIEVAALMPEARNRIPERFRSGKLDLGHRLDVARQLRRNQYRSAIVASRSWKAALVPFLSGIPERIGWFGEFRYPLINRPRFGERHFPRFPDAVAYLGLRPEEQPPPRWPAPRLVVPEATMQQWRETAEEARDPHPILVLAPGARGEFRRWPVEHYAQLARRAVDQGWTVWVTGAAAERPLAEKTSRGLGAVRILTGTPLIPTACQMAVCDAFVGNDSGLLHLAASLGAPCVGVYGGTYAYTGAPLNDGVRIVNQVTAARMGTAAIWASVETVEAEISVLRSWQQGRSAREPLIGHIGPS